MRPDLSKPRPLPAVPTKWELVKGPPVRKIRHAVKANGFEFRVIQLIERSQTQERWKLIGVFGAHVAAKNFIAQLEADEKNFHVERVEVTHFCGHPGVLDHRIPKNTPQAEFDRHAAVWTLRNERAKAMPCIDCFCQLGTSKGVEVRASVHQWHGLLNAPPEKVVYLSGKCEAANCGKPLHACAACEGTMCESCCAVVEKAKRTKFSEDCPEVCASCGTKMREYLVPQQTWHPCKDCGGVLCEKCCETRTDMLRQSAIEAGEKMPDEA